MTFKTRYENRKPIFLSDKKICPKNRQLFKDFLTWEENKLKRTNGLRELDENTYKTLYEYVVRLGVVNQWFNNKAWSDLTKGDIEKVYNDLEDGKIKNSLGKPFKERKNFYNKIFKSKVFEMAGKDGLAREVIQYYRPVDNEVRFIEEQDFTKLQRTAIKDTHKLLFWLAWDIGENVNSLLQLKKKNFIRQVNRTTNEIEYLVFLEKSILKRQRTQRSELTLYRETVEFLEEILPNLQEEDFVFNFDYRNAKKIFDRTIERTKVKCRPNGDKPTWKDLRSGMACHLLKKGWTTDEINSRLGHKPSSDQIDKYVNFLSLHGEHHPKEKLSNSQLQNVMTELQAMKDREKLNEMRFQKVLPSVANVMYLVKEMLQKNINEKDFRDKIKDLPIDF